MFQKIRIDRQAFSSSADPRERAFMRVMHPLKRPGIHHVFLSTGWLFGDALVKEDGKPDCEERKQDLMVPG